MSSIIFKRFKSKGPEFKGHKLASEKSRGTGKTLKRHITVISVYSSIFKIARYLNIITRYRKISVANLAALGCVRFDFF